MKDYIVRLVELAGAGALAGAGSYIAQNGLDLSQAGLRALAVAAGMAAYGVLVKHFGDKDKPTLVK